MNFSLTALNPEGLEDALEHHDKQFLVFSSAGKPIYAYHGNEEKLSSFMATAEALMSVATASRSESLRYLRYELNAVSVTDSKLCDLTLFSASLPARCFNLKYSILPILQERTQCCCIPRS
jgi:First Longin domain of FUZ, MON1 and HPS1